jgi:hypothetical protein
LARFGSPPLLFKRFLVDLPPELDLSVRDPSETASISRLAPRQSIMKNKSSGMTPFAIQATHKTTLNLLLPLLVITGGRPPLPPSTPAGEAARGEGERSRGRPGDSQREEVEREEKEGNMVV